MNATLETEAARLRQQRDLESARSRAERNLLGQFATPPALALAIARYAWRRLSRRRGSFRFLDPAIGTGAFFSAALQAFATSRISDALGAEIDTCYSEIAVRLWSDAGLRVVPRDFTTLRPPDSNGKVDLVLANPPYVRHHHMNTESKRRLGQLVRERLGIEVSGLAGLYCYFLLLCDAWLASNALSMWLIPSEFMDVNYGGCLKTYLTRHVTLEHIHRFCPSEAQFEDALVSSAVVVFRKRSPPSGHQVKFSFGGGLERPRCAQHVALADLDHRSNWTTLPTSDGRLPHRHAQATLGELFSIRRGIATGNNAFFILPKSSAQSLGIPVEFSRPILPSPRYVRQEIIDASEDGAPRLPAPLVVVDCPLYESEIRVRYPEFWNYLQQG
jgi:adenine-specific DNA-methyltransferase